MAPYLICQFSKSTFSNLVRESFDSNFPDVFRKEQVDYIYRYLKDLKAVTILLEGEYLDKDYLEDFSRYYVKSYNNNGHKCARLHFFNLEFDHIYFEEVLKNSIQSDSDKNKIKDIQESYLGFMVVKPLPKTFIGKTCLKRYPGFLENNGTRKSLSREYKVNLFGIKLSVDSVAFQEQDEIISASATTSIWVAFHASDWSNEKHIPACSEITLSAINFIPSSNNNFTNKELTNKQMLRALDVYGFKHNRHDLLPVKSNIGKANFERKSIVDFCNFIKNLTKINTEDINLQEDMSAFFKLIKSHIDSGIPIILSARASRKDSNDPEKAHAITVVGYKNSDENFLYVHDDRFGPFVRAALKLIDKKISLSLSFKDGSERKIHEELELIDVITPLNKKARIPYSLLEQTCKSIKEFLSGAFPEYQFDYDLTLKNISDIKANLLEKKPSPNLSKKGVEDFENRKIKFLTNSYAKFQWQIIFKTNEIETFMILIDATDIPQGNAISSIYPISEITANIQFKALQSLGEMLSSSKFSSELNDSMLRRYKNSFLYPIFKYLQPPSENYFTYLDNKFGKLRAPITIEKNEIIDGGVYLNKSAQHFYEANSSTIENLFGVTESKQKLIWAISHDGAIIIGEDEGHPTLTKFKSARIAGELEYRVKDKKSIWIVSSKSRRYSKNYGDKEEFYLNSAISRFEEFFPHNEFEQDNFLSNQRSLSN